jgi:tight adherence protein C
MLAAVAIGLFAAPAQTASAGDAYRIRVERVETSSYPDVRLVVSVADAAGKPIKGLTGTDLLVTEEGATVKAAIDVASVSAPVGLAFVVDASGSMAGAPLQQAISAMTGMVQRLGPRDQAALITYRQSVDVAQPLTSDKAVVTAAAARVVPSLDTRLASWRGFDDALTLGMNALDKATPGSRSAIVLVTDGFDRTTSAAERESAIARARASRYPIHTIAVGGQIDRATFQAIADASHGTAFYAPTPAELATAYAALGEQLETQYTIAYRASGSAPAGSQRRIRLQLVRATALLAEITTTYAVPGPAQASAPPAATTTTIVVSAGQSVTVTANGAAAAEPPFSLHLAARDALPDAGMPDGAILAGLLSAATALCMALALGAAVSTRTLAALDHRLLAVYVGGHKRVPAGTPRTSLRVRSLLPALSRLAGRFGKRAPHAMTDRVATKLTQAGDPLDLGPAEFFGLRVIAAVVCGVLGAIMAVAATDEPSPLLGVLAAGGMGLIGYVAPGVLLARAVRRRQSEIRRALPAVLDMLALSAGAGMTLDGALAQVTQRWKGPLSDELKRLLLEFNLGRGRRVALRALAARTAVPEIGRLVNALIQADALGIPISRVLQEQAIELRTHRRQLAEEAARTAPVKMLFPMIGLIFPALFVVILGPAVPTVVGLFQQVH